MNVIMYNHIYSCLLALASMQFGKSYMCDCTVRLEPIVSQQSSCCDNICSFTLSHLDIHADYFWIGEFLHIVAVIWLEISNAAVIYRLLPTDHRWELTYKFVVIMYEYLEGLNLILLLFNIVTSSHNI